MQQNDFVSWITQSVAIIGFEFMYKDLQLDKKISIKRENIKSYFQQIFESTPNVLWLVQGQMN